MGLGWSPSLCRGSRSVSGKAAGQSGEGRAADQRETAAELSSRPTFPGATATALSPPPPLQSVAAPLRARASRRQRLGARAPSPGRRRGAWVRQPRRRSREGGRGRAEGGAGRGRRGRERRARESRREREQRARAGERRGRERREKDTRTQRHTVTGIILEKSDTSKGLAGEDFFKSFRRLVRKKRLRSLVLEAPAGLFLGANTRRWISFLFALYSDPHPRRFLPALRSQIASPPPPQSPPGKRRGIGPVGTRAFPDELRGGQT